MEGTVILGSGQDGGLPQFSAATELDRRARDGGLAERTASSVAVPLASGTLLLDATPDLRRQDITRTSAGLMPITDVALTHAHMGHYAGLVHFGREAANADGLRVWMTPSMARYLHDNQPWRSLFEDGTVVARTLDPGEQAGCDGRTIRFYGVRHRAEFTDTVAISIDDRLLYLPDIDDWDGLSDAVEVVGDHETALLDATFYRDGELGDRSHDPVPHPFVVDTVRLFGEVADHVILTHLNHTNALCDPLSSESQAVRDAGFRVASDGMHVAPPQT